jgi:DNA-binding CsgD family transcriptional regulator
VSETLLKAYLAHGDAREGGLTTRERSVVQLIAEGHSNKLVEP